MFPIDNNSCNILCNGKTYVTILHIILLYCTFLVCYNSMSACRKNIDKELRAKRLRERQDKLRELLDKENHQFEVSESLYRSCDNHVMSID